MMLAIDIGNTNITLGMFRSRSGTAERSPIAVWRLSTNRNGTEDEYGPRVLDLLRYAALDPSDVRGVAVASVVPRLDGVFADVSRRYFRQEAYFVTARSAGVTVRYGVLSEVGADRIANAAAAHAFFKGPGIVVDFGTATTFDCVSAAGEYLGGVIAPGPRISAESLFQRTAKLPRAEVVKPAAAIGKSTIDSIQSGLYFGYIGLIKEVLKRIAREMHGKPYVIATGGLAGLIVPEIKEVKRVLPELTLEGIRILWEKNGKKARGAATDNG